MFAESLAQNPKKTRRKVVTVALSEYDFQASLRRLQWLQQGKEAFEATFDAPQQEEKAEARRLDTKSIEFSVQESRLTIGEKVYDLGSYRFLKELEEHYKKLERQIEKEWVVALKYLSAVEFNLLCSKYCTNSTLHFSATDICSICQFELFEGLDWDDFEKMIAHDAVVAGLPCDHYYHLECLENCMKESHIQCPVCSTIYGVKMGDQPEGMMHYHLNPELHCEGYEDTGTIVIYYEMFPGMRNGARFPSTNREAFLPDCKEGRQVLRLLKTAFERKLIFTVGRSVTTGKDNRIVWSGIHHKTNLNGGASFFGYPDPTYFSRVKEELASKGVI